LLILSFNFYICNLLEALGKIVREPFTSDYSINFRDDKENSSSNEKGKEDAYRYNLRPRKEGGLVFEGGIEGGSDQTDGNSSKE
jgi:hypothetical protein